MQDNDKTSYEELVLEWLRSKSGDVVVVSSIAKKFKVGSASILTLLNELAAEGKVRRSNAKRSVGFYVPSQGMLNAERKAAEQAQVAPAHKISKQRQELYARLDKERNSYPSIG
jgi:methylmalonyl-CoA mutase cobalamin-binding subunit